MTPKEQAELILMEIAEAKAVVEALAAGAEERMELIRAEYQRKAAANLERLKQKDKEIKKLMKAETGAIFDGADKVTLTSGVLLHEKKDHVTIPRDALSAVKEHGFLEAVKVVESLDREVVEKWPEERLFLIGAVRKPKHAYSYEITGEKKKK